jgi:hypothetical protein
MRLHYVLPTPVYRNIARRVQIKLGLHSSHGGEQHRAGEIFRVPTHDVNKPVRLLAERNFIRY